MSDDTSQQSGSAGSAQSTLIIPDGIREKHGELIDLIVGSESMNDEERQYWINILPVMTPDQLQNLHQILQNERNQLKEIDAKYQKEMDRVTAGHSVEEIESAQRAKRDERAAIEKKHEAEEAAKEQEILAAIAELG